MEKTKKRKFWQCAHLEREYDDLGKYAWCHSRECNSRECICDSIFEMNVCPYFKKGESSCFLEYSDYDKMKVAEFLAKIKKEQDEIEAKERALYEQLKKKYG